MFLCFPIFIAFSIFNDKGCIVCKGQVSDTKNIKKAAINSNVKRKNYKYRFSNNHYYFSCLFIVNPTCLFDATMNLKK